MGDFSPQGASGDNLVGSNPSIAHQYKHIQNDAARDIPHLA